MSKKSPLAGKSLKEAQVPEGTGMCVLCIKRGDKWIRPKPGTVIEAGHHLFASGYTEGVDDLKRLVNSEKRVR